MPKMKKTVPDTLSGSGLKEQMFLLRRSQIQMLRDLATSTDKSISELGRLLFDLAFEKGELETRLKRSTLEAQLDALARDLEDKQAKKEALEKQLERIR